MCGRLNTTDHEGVRWLLDILGIPLDGQQLPEADYNVSPDSRLFAVSHNGPAYHCGLIRWGLRPAWAREGQFKRPLINARADSVWDKPSFREAIRRRRLLVPITGFYEWHREDGQRQPHYFHAAAQPALALAALWERDPEGQPGCALLTTEANATMAPVHDRMPVILPTEAMADWLSSTDRVLIESLLRPADDDLLNEFAVGRAVNNAREHGPACVEPLEDKKDGED